MSEALRLSGKRALVTGGGSGIGRASAHRLAAEGARVAVLDASRGSAQDAADDVRRKGGEALALCADVRSEDEVAGAVESCLDAWQGLDVVVVNAAVQLFGQDTLAHELPTEVWDQTVAINLRGAFLTCKHVLPALMRSESASLICTASPTGLFGKAPEFTAYSTSKAGIFGLVRVLAAGYAAHNVRVNAVVPGFTDTGLVQSITSSPERMRAQLSGVPLGRPGTADEVAGLICYLASDEASYATGAIFTIDGGMTAV